MDTGVVVTLRVPVPYDVQMNLNKWYGNTTACTCTDVYQHPHNSFTTIAKLQFALLSETLQIIIQSRACINISCAHIAALNIFSWMLVAHRIWKIVFNIHPSLVGFTEVLKANITCLIACRKTKQCYGFFKNVTFSKFKIKF